MERLPVTARAPGKVILSGEHSAVYGAPALTLAVDRYTQVRVQPNRQSGITFKLLSLGYEKNFSWVELQAVKPVVQARYARWVAHQLPIEQVLTASGDLLVYAASYLLEELGAKLEGGVTIEVSSEVPLGCGMGSSAAVIMALIQALTSFLHVEIDFADYLAWGKEIEKLQHGVSSGIDLVSSLQGGGNLACQGQFTNFKFELPSLRIINTGVPCSSTGECVEQVAKVWDKTWLPAFTEVTLAIQRACVAADWEALKLGFSANHRLLMRLGVVPAKVVAFIAAVERLGGAAKVSGAGAVRGERGGILLLVGGGNLGLLAASYGYELLPMTGSAVGVHLV